MTLTRRSIILISLCAGLLAALLTYRFLARERTRAARMTQPISVVVTTRPIAARTVIEPTAVREQARPAATLPANCATSVHEVIGQVAMSSLMANEPVPRKAVAPPTASLGLAYAVPDGKRAVAVALDPIIGVAGFLKPGDRVDVAATFTVDKLKVTKTVLQDVTLLAIGPEIRPEDEKRPAANKTARPKEQANATLAVTPEQAEKLILAESGGKLRLTLRPAEDRTVLALTGIRSDALIGTRLSGPARTTLTPPPRLSSSAPPAYRISSPPTQAPPRSVRSTPRPHDALSVETIRGTQKTTVEVNAN